VDRVRGAAHRAPHRRRHWHPGQEGTVRLLDDRVFRDLDDRPDFDPDVWTRKLPAMDLFGALVFQIIGQQIS
jgi:hypothetical protein